MCEPQLRAPKTELRSGGRVCGHSPSDRPRDFAPSWNKQRLLNLLYTTLRVPAPHRDVAAFMAHVQGLAEAAGDVAVAAMAPQQTAPPQPPAAMVARHQQPAAPVVAAPAAAPKQPPKKRRKAASAPAPAD